MKCIAKIKAQRRPLMTPILVVGWLVASPDKGMAPKGDYSALQGAEASEYKLHRECSPMLLFPPKRALNGISETAVEGWMLNGLDPEGVGCSVHPGDG